MLGLILFSDGTPVNDDGGGGRIRNGGALACNRNLCILPNLQDDQDGVEKRTTNGYHLRTLQEGGRTIKVVRVSGGMGRIGGDKDSGEVLQKPASQWGREGEEEDEDGIWRFDREKKGHTTTPYCIH